LTQGAGRRLARRLQFEGQEYVPKPVNRRSLSFHPVDEEMKQVFDSACELLHYAGACRRVGRLMRLAIVEKGRWVGGIVLGSPFPNLRARDDAFGLTKHVLDWRRRGLISPWARENRAYWRRLQLIVNQARAFVFPDAEGRRIGLRAHALLETAGRALWEDVYGPLVGFDTLCTHPTSRLFRDNGWLLVGQTKGYARDPDELLSSRVAAAQVDGVKDNAGLSFSPSNPRWWIWVRVLAPLP